jgi:hypothetical protein
MSRTLPQLVVPPRPVGWSSVVKPETWAWTEIAALPPLLRADDGQPAQQQTQVRVCFDETALYLRFDCDDRDIWGTFSHRDEAIYDEEVVELFIGPGEADPIEYAEFEVSPNGVLFDGWVKNPTSQRTELVIDTGWDCPGLYWSAGRDDEAHHWWAVLVVPWAELTPASTLTAGLPHIWRANFYRIERPRDGEVEYSCWSPPLVEPVDFHKPAAFGTLILPNSGVSS